jgi:hypothetical protein
MDLLDLTQQTRESRLDYDETSALVRFGAFRLEEDGESQANSGYTYGQICEKLSALYPDVSFNLINHDVFARVKDGINGALVEKIGLVTRDVPYLTTTVAYGSCDIFVVFREDGIGVTRQDSDYDFFRHDLDLEEVRQECQNDEEQISEALCSAFLEDIRSEMEDPFFDPEDERCALYFTSGSNGELDRLMRLFILTEPGIELHEEENVRLYAALEDADPYLAEDDYEGYHSKRLVALAEVALSENRPVGWEWEYNDGAYDRKSGYTQCAEVLTYNISEILEQSSSREKMVARRELGKYLEARGYGLASFDALANKEGDA